MTPQPTIATRPVTRMEIAEHIADAFDGDAVHRIDVLQAAGEDGARSEVVRVLERLPQRRYYRLTDVWSVLPDVPVEL